MAEVLTTTPERVLACYAHPDDPEVSCGGTLARWAGEGAEVHAVVGTRGEKGSSDPGADVEALARQRAEEVAEGAARLGLAGVEVLGWPDGELDNTIALRAALVARIRALRPHAVVCPDPTAVLFGDGYVNHHDHRGMGWAALDAVAPMAASPLYFPGRDGPHQVADVYLSGTLEPDVWVDVTGTLDDKVAALRCHRSQLGGSDEWVRALVHQRAEDAGRRAGLTYAESFRRLRFRR